MALLSKEIVHVVVIAQFITFWGYNSMCLEQRFSFADEFLKEQPFSFITASKQQLFRARRARAKP